MMGRDRRNGRANLKTRLGIATAVLAGGSAIGVAAVAATSHGGAAATQTGYSTGLWHQRYASEWTRLNTAMNDWTWSRQTSYTMLSGVTQPTFSQTTQHGRTFAEQRGVVVLATNQFIVLQSANGSLHLWLLSGHTIFQNVSNTTAGTAAMTANQYVTTQAMQQGNMIPMTNVMAGGAQTVSQMLTPQAQPETITIQVPGTDLTVTITISHRTATVSQTATMPQNANPWWNPTSWTQNPWSTVSTMAPLARGDVALIVGFRSHGLLHARLVLFTPMTTATIGGATGGTIGGTSGTTPVPVASSTAGLSGTHY